MKKITGLLSMALCGLVAFSSCSITVPIIDKENARARISEIKPDKEINAVVVGLNKVWVLDNGKQTEYDILSEAKKYYSVDKDYADINYSYLYDNWLYYTYEYDYKSVKSEISTAFMRLDVNTGKIENIYDCGVASISYKDDEIYDERYYFLYNHGLLKIYDMQKGEFIHEHILQTKEEIKELLKADTYIPDAYFFYHLGEEENIDYVKDGQYYRWGDGGYTIIDVPSWITACDAHVYRMDDVKVYKNYVYTNPKDEITEVKAYDLVAGVEVDFDTVVKGLLDENENKQYFGGHDFKRENEIASANGYAYIQTEDTFYSFMYLNGAYGTPAEIRQRELDENGNTINETAITIDAEYILTHSETLAKLHRSWYPNKEGRLSIGEVGVCDNRAFFTFDTYYGNFFYGVSSDLYLVELNPVTNEFYYLAHFPQEVYERLLYIFLM